VSLSRFGLARLWLLLLGTIQKSAVVAPGEKHLLCPAETAQKGFDMIRKLASGKYRLYSRKINPKTGKRRNLGTFKSRSAAEKHERAVQYFKRG
jgi:hypothetical protein